MLSGNSLLSGALSGPRTHHSTSSVDLDSMSLCSTLTSDFTEQDQTMENYGHLLLCPVCKELITHPVLLPCQHSVCYGCARSQILAAESVEGTQADVTQAHSPHGNRIFQEESLKNSPSLRSTPSESSILSSSSKRDSGIETSPSITSSLTKGFSFVSTASSSCSSGSNDLHHQEENFEENLRKGEKQQNMLKPRRILPKLSSSPRPNKLTRQSSINQASSLTRSTSSQLPANAAERPEVVSPGTNDGNLSDRSSVVYTTNDMVHFEASIIDGNEQNFVTPSENGSSTHSHKKQRKASVKTNGEETPKSTGARQRIKSAGKFSRRNSSKNGPFSPPDSSTSSMTSFCTPPSSLMTSSLKRTQTSSGGGLRRSNSASTITRSSSRSSMTRGADVIKRSKVKSLFCPTCESDVELGRFGIKGLFRNFALESIVERFRTAAKAAVAIRCGYCKPPASDATKSCLDCKLSYCNQCYKTVHVWGTKKAQHEFVGPTNNFSRPKVMLCPEHGTEAVNMYCNRCQHSVCRMCKSRGGAHSNHPIISVKNAYKESKDRLYGLLDVLKNKRESMDEAIGEMENDIKKFEAEETAVRDEIHSAIDEMHKLLELKRTELLEKAEQQARSKENDLRRDLQNLRNNAMYSSVMAFAEEVLLETDPAYFLQTIKMVETRVNDAIEHMSKIPRSANDKNQEIDSYTIMDEMGEMRRNMMRLYLNMGPAKDAIESFNFLKVPGKPVLVGQLNSNVISKTTSRALGQTQSDIQWQLEKDLDGVDIFEMKYWKNLAGKGKENATEYHQVSGPEFRIPFNSGLCEKDEKFFVKVRGLNKAGTGPWSDVTTVSTQFLRRDVFKLLSESRSLEISSCGRTAKMSKFEVQHSQQARFHFLAGDAELSGRTHYWEVEAYCVQNFHFLLGLADLSGPDETNLTNGNTQFCESLDPASSALLYCGPQDCYVVGCSGRELEYLPSGKTGSFPKETGSKKGMKQGNKSSSNFFPLKPLKQLKNSLLRRSSFTGPSRNVSAKFHKNTRHYDNSGSLTDLVNGNDDRFSSGLLRSSSATSLPSILRSQSSVTLHNSSAGGSKQNWNVREQFGCRCFRIGVEMTVRSEGQVDVEFKDLSVFSSTKTMFFKTLEASSPLTPVLAISGEGQISVI